MKLAKFLLIAILCPNISYSDPYSSQDKPEVLGQEKNEKALDIKPQEQYVIRIHHFLGPKSLPREIIIDPWKKKIESESMGRLKVEVFDSMSMGGSPENLVDQVRQNQVEAILTSVGYNDTEFPRLSVMLLPFMINSTAAKYNLALLDFYDSYLKNSGELDGFKVLMISGTCNDSIHFISEKNVPKNINDFKGKLIRVSSRQIADLVSNLGASPVFCPASKLYEEISHGSLDAAACPYELLSVTKTAEIIQAHLNFPVYGTVFTFLMNKDFYSKLPEDLKKIIDKNSMDKNFAIQVGQSCDRIEDDAMRASINKSNKNSVSDKFYELDSDGNLIEQKISTFEDLKIKRLEAYKSRYSSPLAPYVLKTQEKLVNQLEEGKKALKYAKETIDRQEN